MEKFKNQQFWFIKHKLYQCNLTGNNDLWNVLIKQATQGKVVLCFTLK